MQRKEIKDPILRGIIITTVEATHDLKKIYIYFKAEEKQYSNKVLKSYIKAKGFLRKELFTDIQMRYIPDIELKPDYSEVSRKRIEELLKDE